MERNYMEWTDGIAGIGVFFMTFLLARALTTGLTARIVLFSLYLFIFGIWISCLLLIGLGGARLVAPDLLKFVWMWYWEAGCGLWLCACSLALLRLRHYSLN